MEIWILRHAKAEKGGPGKPDEERALTPAARKRMRSAARTIDVLKPGFDAILTSPLRRALQTAEPVAKALNRRGKLLVTDSLSPYAEPKEVLEEIRARRLRRPLVVGHMPHLGRLLGLLLTGRPGNVIELKKGALARVEFDGSSARPPGTLTLLLTSKALARDSKA